MFAGMGGVTECSVRCTKEDRAAALAFALLLRARVASGTWARVVAVRRLGTPCQLAGILEGVLRL